MDENDYKLYNEYSAYTDRSLEISRKVEEMIKGVIEENSDCNIRELELVVVNTTWATFSEHILINALRRSRLRRFSEQSHEHDETL